MPGLPNPWLDSMTPAVTRLAAHLRKNPDQLQALVWLLDLPLPQCEGHGGPCEARATRIVRALTRYEWHQADPVDPNRDLSLCDPCAEAYTEEWTERIREYESSVMPRSTIAPLPRRQGMRIKYIGNKDDGYTASDERLAECDVRPAIGGWSVTIRGNPQTRNPVHHNEQGTWQDLTPPVIAVGGVFRTRKEAAEAGIAAAHAEGK